MRKLLSILLLLASGFAHAVVDMADKPAAGSYSYNTGWAGASGVTEPSCYWHMDEGTGTTLQSQGDCGDNDFTLTGPDWSTEGSAATLTFVEANNDYATALDAGIDGTTDFTMAILVKFTSDENHDVMMTGDNSVTNKYQGHHATTNCEAGAKFRNTTLGSGGATADMVCNDTTWHLLWYVWDADAGVSGGLAQMLYDNSLYWDAGLLTLDAADANFNGNALAIGSLVSSTPAGSLDAEVGGFMVWAGVELSEAQMDDIHDNMWAWLDVGPSLSGTIRQSQTDTCSNNQWGTSNCRVTLAGGTLSAGDLIVVAHVASEDSSGMAPVLPSEGGYSQGPYYSNGTAGNLSCSISYKKAAGTETTITPSWTKTNIGLGRVLAVVFSGTDLNLDTLEASGESEAQIASASTSISSGSAANTTPDALGIAAICTDALASANNVTAWSNSWVEQAEAATDGNTNLWFASKVVSAAATQTTTATITSDQGYGGILVFGTSASSASCPETCAGGRTGVCISSTASSADADNILNGQSPAVVADADTICYDATSDILADVVTVDASGWVKFQSGGDIRTDDIDYCIMDDGAACGTDGVFQITQTPPDPTGVSCTATGQTTADCTSTITQVEGTAYLYISTSATPPSTANHKSGGGSPAFHNADATVTATQAWSVTGLSAGTTYYPHAMQANGATTPIDTGQVTGALFITQAAGDTTPADDFDFGSVSGAAPLGHYCSDPQTITEINAATNVLVSNGTWRRYTSGAWGDETSDAGVVIVNDQVIACGDAPDFGGQNITTVTIGGVDGIWTIFSASERSGIVRPTMRASRNRSMGNTVY